MGRRKKEQRRVLGPQRDGERWRVVLVEATGQEFPRKYRTKEEADAVAKELREEINEVTSKTIDQAIVAYGVYMREDKGNKELSVKDTQQRLHRFFAGPTLLLGSVTKKECERLYEKLRTTLVKRGKAENAPMVPLAVATHRHILLESRSFLRWCLKQGWLKMNPLDGVEGKGKRKRGKPQLTIDELRVWVTKALELAQAGDDGALAALMAPLMGPRASEITRRLVRDIDDDGRIFRISDAKTEAGERQVEIPEILRPLIAEHIKGRKADEWLFTTRGKEKGPHWRDWPRENVQRICRLAGLPSVTAHGMRGSHATLAVQAGIASHLVAAQLGHTSFDNVTAKNYAQPAAVKNATARAAMKVLDGGRK